MVELPVVVDDVTPHEADEQKKEEGIESIGFAFLIAVNLFHRPK